MTVLQHVKSTLLPHVNYMSETFREFLRETALGGKVTSGIGVSDSGIVAAFLEYSPRGDPAEDVLDAVIDITITNNRVHYEADVCWSSGKVLAEIAERSINYDTSQELLSFVDEQTARIRDDLLSSLMTFAKTTGGVKGDQVGSGDG